jgi:hypothetical protein
MLFDEYEIYFTSETGFLIFSPEGGVQNRRAHSPKQQKILVFWMFY